MRPLRVRLIFSQWLKTFLLVACLLGSLSTARANNGLFSWGYMTGSSETASTVPAGVNLVDFPDDVTIVALATGRQHALALGSNGILYSWGDNNFGQLGNGNFESSRKSVVVRSSGVMANKTIVAIACGNFHSLALSSDGQVFSWGQNTNGQLGNGYITNSNFPTLGDPSGILNSRTVKAIGAGAYHSVVLTSDNLLVSWGNNFYGQLGNGANVNSPLPVAVDMSGVLAGKTIAAFAVGGAHNLVLTTDGGLYTWGWNYWGSCGDTTYDNRNLPVAVDMSGLLNGLKITAIQSSYVHSLVLTETGRVYGWGYNGAGELGIGPGTFIFNTPVATDTSGVLAGKTITSISSSNFHTLALDSDGKLYSWGEGQFGKLGNGSTADCKSPVLVDTSGVLAGKTITRAIAGGYFSLVTATGGDETVPQVEVAAPVEGQFLGQ